MIHHLVRLPLRLFATGWVAVARAFGGWSTDRPGVHAIALTPAGRIVLVRLRYASGWRLPGGGRGADEYPAGAAVRELREEIGMFGHGAVEAVAPAGADGLPELFIVRDVVYSPLWSLEVEEVIEAAPDALPPGLAAAARQMLAHALAAGERHPRPDSDRAAGG